MNFNEQQLKAINFKDGACAVIAGAGSGKTTVLIERVKKLVQEHNVIPSDILIISFTVNTVKELKTKLKNINIEGVNIDTSHGICRRILLSEGIDIDAPVPWDIENLFNSNYSEKVDVDDILSFISFQKNNMKTYKDEFIFKDSKYEENKLRNYFKQYEDFKIKKNLKDSDDQLLDCYYLLHNKKNKYDHTFKYVLVDESQDNNLVQNLLLHEWCKSGNIFCIGDFRQCIYSFRGSKPDMFMNFDKEWNDATIINLDTNYRSCQDIVNKANNFVRRYYGNYRYYSNSKAYNNSKAHIDINTYMHQQDESNEVVNKIQKLLQEGEKPNEIAVLYRLNSHSHHVEGELRRRKIPYYISNNSSFFKRKEIEGVMSYLRLIDNPYDNSAFENIFKFRNYPIQFFSNKLLQDIKSFAGRNNLSLYEAFTLFKYKENWQEKNMKIFENNIEKLRLQKDKNIDICKLIDNVKLAFNIEEYIECKYSNREDQEDRLNSIETLKSFVKGNNLQGFINYAYNSSNKKKQDNKDCVKLMTIHSSKGLEFKHVFIIGIEDGKFPHKKSEIIDEARLFYVGVTRPKENLYLSQINQGNKFIEEYVS
ncbi:ATP-dependent helicase [Clostridium botulinum C]|uniref:DNA 3'-5' helicase n=2 Tax=Clostridium botulinum TaxID=1491 RepID=A0A9Q4TNV7_CLOBO|nr:ATP-dependent helicase [Clostridium botulinum]YP_398613.1 DNA helicase [Clostridium phage c-st]MCD3196091.1 ATP-dependent helicase [Clostridium botulinum C]MCD3200305.1 ATP-dependent helicase [Clostridium botulinum C]MCD3206947.1 ATP-dependent helicase [Clostridium botulinum C]MCD3207537.1 ATP-dependent helicase [Clostridium botulinum C]MCD3217338.1 ATP-dependent helicase [Clostridium botulinum C]